MKLETEIEGQPVTVVLKQEGSRVNAAIGDRKYELDAREIGGQCLLRLNGAVFNCRVEGAPESGQSVNVIVNSQRYAVTLIDPKRLRSAAGAGAHGDGTARIVAPMPGKIVRVLVEKGSSVEAGAAVVVVEAMKMQNEMKAPKAGVVTAVNVEVGATVNGGDVLAVIE